MPRKSSVVALLGLAFFLSSHDLRSAPPLEVRIAPVGPSAAALAAIRDSLPANPALRRYLEGTSHRLLSFSLLDTEVPGSQRGGAHGLERLDRYRAVFYDYTHNRALQVDGLIVPGNGNPVRVTVLAEQPNTNEEEFQAALLIVKQDPELGPAISRGALLPYPPMPPVLEPPSPDLVVERTVNVGLLATDGGVSSQIVGVNMIQGTVVRSTAGAPLESLSAAVAASCGLANANQATTSRGTAGQYAVTISRSGAVVWTFTVMRPAISTGVTASGIELRDVKYRGKSVLYQAHLPILNVKYTGDSCGPFRDWQWQENPFVAAGTDVAPGIRNASAPPQTIFDNGTDTGTFAGVAYYIGASDVVFVTELQAGWYRYIMSWRFLDNGTIQPRMAFDAVSNACVCNAHTHHAYWRFDFDIGTAENNAVSERKKRSYQIVSSETSGKRGSRWGSDLLVRNTVTGNTYRIVPGAYDGVADTFGVADYWLLRWNTGQIDDGVSCVTCANAYIQIGKYVNGESIQGQDIVVWYGAHFSHDLNDQHGPEIVGPDLVVSSW